jgi:hypothetical protein
VCALPNRKCGKTQCSRSRCVDCPTQRRLVVEGKLIAPWAAELKSACEEAKGELSGGDLVVEMKHVTTISQEGENVIVQLISAGIKFRGRALFTKHMLKELTREATSKLPEMKNE